jgi:hypothetical protein
MAVFSTLLGLATVMIAIVADARNPAAAGRCNQFEPGWAGVVELDELGW